MKNLVLVRLFPYESDSRAKRHYELLSPEVTLFWSKDDSTEISSFYLKYQTGFLGAIKYLVNFLFLMFFSSYNILIKKRVILAMDLDSYIASSLFGFLGGNVVFDCVDPFSEARFRRFKFLKNIVKSVEEYMMGKSLVTVFPSEGRKKFYRRIPPESLVVKNIPSFFEFIDSIESNSKKDVVTIGYIGGVTHSRHLEDLCEIAINNDFIRVVFFGGGEAEHYLKVKYSDYKNIKFNGSFDYENLSKCYADIDVSFACYDLCVDFHKYAAPNKFYEALIFRKMLIVNKGVIDAEPLVKSGHAIFLDDFSGIVSSLEKVKSFKEYLKNIEFPSSSSIYEVLHEEVFELKKVIHESKKA